jgi:hypothetical protein
MDARNREPRRSVPCTPVSSADLRGLMLHAVSAL